MSYGFTEETLCQPYFTLANSELCSKGIRQISSFFISAIEFLIDDEDSLPKQVKYAIRLRSEVYSPWNTDSTYPQYISDSPASAQ